MTNAQFRRKFKGPKSHFTRIYKERGLVCRTGRDRAARVLYLVFLKVSTFMKTVFTVHIGPYTLYLPNGRYINDYKYRFDVQHINRSHQYYTIVYNCTHGSPCRVPALDRVGIPQLAPLQECVLYNCVSERMTMKKSQSYVAEKLNIFQSRLSFNRRYHHLNTIWHNIQL